MKKQLILVFALISVLAKSQNPIYLGFGFDAGVPTANEYAGNKSILNPTSGHHFNSALYVSTVFSERIGLELGVGQNNQVVKFEDKKFKENHGGRYESTTNFQNLFPNVEASLSFNQPISDNRALYLKLGWRMNYPGNKTYSNTKTFNLDDTKIESEGTYTKKSAALVTEIGMKLGGSGGSQGVLGLKYVHGYETNATMAYTSTQVLNNVSDVFSTKGSYIGMFLGVNIFVTEWDYPSFSMNIGGGRKPRRSSSSSSSSSSTSSPSTTNSTSISSIPGNRSEEVVRTLTISDPNVTLKIYDPNKVDNDIVSVWLNGVLIIENLSVKKEPYLKEITLAKGLNKITFQAMNLGKVSPNTAEMIVLANGANYKVTFNTTLEKNQVLEIIVP